MQERRLNMRAGRGRPYVSEPRAVDDSAYWSATDPVSEPLSRAATTTPPQPQQTETYVERVWSLAKRTVSDLLGLSSEEPPRAQRRVEGEHGSRAVPQDTPQRYPDESVNFSGGIADTPAVPAGHPSKTVPPPQLPESTGASYAPAPSAAPSASNITVYQFYAAPAAPSFYPSVSGRTVPNGGLNAEPDLFVPRVSLLSRPVLTYSGQKRARTQDRPLTPLAAPALGTLRPPPPAQSLAAPAVGAATKPMSLDVSTTEAAPTAPPQPKPFASFGQPRAAPAPSATPAPAAKPATNGFFNPGPPVDIVDDDGFASNADSSEDEDKAPANKAADTPAKAPFSFGASNPFAPKPATADTPAPAPASTTSAPNKPFSFGMGGSTAAVKPAFGSAPASTATPAPSATPAPAAKPATNGFFNPGPPVDIVDDDGFASNADSSEDEDKAPANKAADTPAKAPFSFGLTPSATTSADSTAARPANPFSFGMSSANTAVKPAFGQPSASASGSATENSKPAAPIFSFGLS